MVEIVTKKPNIIMDNGTDTTRVGFSSENLPKYTFPTILAYPKFSCCPINWNKQVFFIAKEFEVRKGILNPYYPIENGIITKWEEMEKLWGATFQKVLTIKPSEYSILLSYNPENPKENIEKITQIMFEAFDVKNLYLGNQSLLSLFSSGKTTGISINFGENITHITPIFEGKILSENKMALGGNDLTKYMEISINEIDKTIDAKKHKNIIENIKKEICYVSLNYEEELKTVEPFECKLHNGNNVTIQSQRIKCPEIIFNPAIFNKNEKGIVEVCYDIIQKCDESVRANLCNNIVISGGNSMFRQLPERFIKEMNNLIKDDMKDKINVLASNERNLNTWIGAV